MAFRVHQGQSKGISYLWVMPDKLGIAMLSYSYLLQSCWFVPCKSAITDSPSNPVPSYSIIDGFQVLIFIILFKKKSSQ